MLSDDWKLDSLPDSKELPTLNGRCHNDLMDFARDVCDSCGEPFCDGCLIYPRGAKSPPFCTHCAMALSGVRNRRPVKPLGRSEVRRRRKELRNQLQDQEQQPPIEMPGTDLINGPALEQEVVEESAGLLNRFRRRKSDQVEEPEPEPLPEYHSTIMAGGDGGGEDDEDRRGMDRRESDRRSATPATEILGQLKEGLVASEGADGDPWPSSGADSPSGWDVHAPAAQSPLGQNSPWGNAGSDPGPSPFDVDIETHFDPGELSFHNEPQSAGTYSASPLGGEGFSAQPAEFDQAATGAPMFVSEASLNPPPPSAAITPAASATDGRGSGRADQDNAGNWVPPILRGMAPEAGSNGDELPKRRRRPPPED